MRLTKSIISHLLLSGFLLRAVVLAGNTKATFRLHAPPMLYPLTRIYIAGTFNGWNPGDSSYVLHELSKGRYAIELTLPSGSAIEYKYTLGSWDGVEKTPDGSERPNRMIFVHEGLVQKDTVSRWALEAVNRGYWKYEELEPFQTSFVLPKFDTQIQEARTPAEIDSVIKAAQISWKNEAAKHFPRSEVLIPETSTDVPYHPGKQNIGGGGFSPQMYVYFIIDPRKKTIDDDRRFYITTNYIIPAFVDEYPFLRKDPNPMKAYHVVESMNVFGAAVQYTVPDAQLRPLYKIYEEMPQLIDIYLSKKIYARSDVREALERFQANLIAQHALWRTMDAMQHGRRDNALAQFKTDLLTSGDNPEGRAQVALRLFAQCMAAHENERALDLLDFLTSSTHDGFLPRDSLKARYLVADPLDGLRRYETKVKSRPTFTLAASDSSVQLTREYIDAATGSTVRLDSLRGKIVLVDVWASWCTPCRLEIPDLSEFAQHTKGRADFVFISVIADLVTGGKSGTEIARFLEENGVRYRVLLDVPERSLIERWKVRAFPTKLLFDESGRFLRGPKNQLTLQEADSFLENRGPAK